MLFKLQYRNTNTQLQKTHCERKIRQAVSYRRRRLFQILNEEHFNFEATRDSREHDRPPNHDTPTPLVPVFTDTNLLNK